MSNKKWAFLFPGQGAQYPGMGRDFYEQFPAAKAVFEEADALLQTHFSRLIFEGPLETLTLTKNSQIAIYVTSAAILRVVQQQFPELIPTVCAGLSLGEYTALMAAGKMSFAQGLELVKVRAEAMHAACEKEKGTMQVVLGLTEEAIETALSTDPSQRVWIANLNCPGQVVIAGTLDAIAWAAQLLKQKGAKRCLPLDVSGAFHSELMRSAQLVLTPKIQSTKWQESATQIVMNVPGDYVTTQGEIEQNLIAQVISAVRWEKGIHRMVETQVEGYFEMGPGKTLQGMNKRIGIEAATLSIEKISDLDTIAAWLQHQEVQCSC